MATILITGANRGIGLEFVKQYLAQGDQVIACCRQPQHAEALQAHACPQLQVLPLDVTSADSVAALKQQLGDQSIDVLICNAGVYGPRRPQIGNIDYDAWKQVLDTNTLGPMRVTEALLSNLLGGSGKTLAVITSKMGSMGDNKGGGAYIYRSSKAAVNAAIYSIARDYDSQGLNVALIHPGWVQTDMGGANALIDSQTSVSGMRQVIADLPRATENGAFFNYDGRPIPW